MAHAVIAVRGGPSAKSRCREIFGPEARALLVEAMLADMIEALARAPSISAIHVVTPTESLFRVARSRGAEVLAEANPAGLNAAFESGRHRVAELEPGVAMVLLPGDLPLLDPTELEEAIAAHSAGTVVLIPAGSDGGTGAIIYRADIPLRLEFGHDSFRRHVANVRTLGLIPRIIQAPSIGFDIDYPRHVDALQAHLGATRTQEFLQKLGSLRHAGVGAG